ncbi:DNA transfer protein [Tatumella terrea]|uniref:lytic transglycosylase domain-containing protein n=1 Tax=Tatumella terrea TaxID=419007 RepID=UPI0031DE5778
MDVRLPNGRVISNVPEGTTKQQVMDKAIQNGLASKSDFDIGQSPNNIQQSAPQQGADVVSATEQKYGIPSGLLRAVISKESSGNPNALSPKGAIGLGQVMPETAKGMGYNPERLKSDPDMQVDAAGKYLGQMLRQNGGDVTSALASYNWGPGNVQKYQSGQNQAMPQETQEYINDPRFAQWTQQQKAQPGSDAELDQLSQEANQPWVQEQPSPTMMQNVEQAGKGLLQAGVNVANIPGSVVNTALDAVGVPKQDQVYQFQLPQSARPTDPYAQLGAEIGPYLVPGFGAEKAAAATASAIGASRTERAANQVASMLSENLVGTLAGSQQNGQIDPTQLLENTGMGMAGSVVARAVPAVFNGVRGAAQDSKVMRAAGNASPTADAGAINTANDVVNLAKSQNGRNVISGQAANVSSDISDAANTAGVDVNKLTPGMASGSRGIAHAEGALASVPGVVQDAHHAAFNEIATNLNRNLDEFGAEAGTASEKSSAIKQRIQNNLDDMRNAEKSAWDDVRSTMPNQRMPMSNANAVIQSERSAGVPLSPEMKQLLSSNNGGVTFDGMKAWRAKFADAEQKYIRGGESNAARRAGEVRRAITDDMQSLAQRGGFLDSWSNANELSKARITAQNNAESLFGRGLVNDTLITKGSASLRSSAANGLNGQNGFHSIISSLPESERVPAISSIIQDALSHGVRGGKADSAGINHIASVLTPQNIQAISRYSRDLGRIADAYGTLARSAVKPQQYIEQTGRTSEVLKALDSGIHPIAKTVLDAVGNSVSGAVVGGAGGGMAGAAIGATAGAALKSTIAKISATRSGRYAIEKAVREGVKVAKSGGSPAQLKVAERRFLADKVAVKAIKDAVGIDGLKQLLRVGIVSTLSGMSGDNNQ